MSTRLFDFLKMINTSLNSRFIKLKAKEANCRDDKKFNSKSFSADLALGLDHTNKDDDSFENDLKKTLNIHHQ